MNHLYDDIINNQRNDGNFYKEKYQQIYNALKTEFRLAEKENGPQR